MTTLIAEVTFDEHENEWAYVASHATCAPIIVQVRADGDREGVGPVSFVEAFRKLTGDGVVIRPVPAWLEAIIREWVGANQGWLKTQVAEQNQPPTPEYEWEPREADPADWHE
jgi:hypothetical protein